MTNARDVRRYQPIRVLVVEDARPQRELLVALLHASDDFEVVGIAGNGKDAVVEAHRLRPHVIAMDIHLPILDGYEATRQIMRQCPTPIVLLSGQADPAGYMIEGLAAGALAVVGKPGACRTTLDTDGERIAFLTMLRLMADVRVVTRHPPYVLAAARRGVTSGGQWSASSRPTVLAIAASTGGPAAVQSVLCGLGADFPLPILVVQHIGGVFVPLLAEWLNNTTPLSVRVARQGDRLVPGQISMAPQNHHIIICEPGIIGLQPARPGDRFCPSADVLFESVAHICRARAIGLVLTGMGDDGAHGLLALRAAGAPTLAQNAESCVVYGMPRAAIEAGAITRTESLVGIVAAIWELVGGIQGNRGAP